MSLHFTGLNPSYMEKWQATNPGQVPTERIPDEMLEKIRKSRSLDKSLWFLYQIHSAVAQFDIAVHSSTSREELLQLEEDEAV
ncbi:hypothetical protein F5B20DRAFT_584314 [Whalleya microplaca]|nr:hypothetical protein F5B20DRAFT_584314 [Whalleya microplaca]